MTRPRVAASLGALLCVLYLPAVAAQAPNAPGQRPRSSAAPPPPPPIAPETVTRNAEGGVAVRAVRITDPITLDGILDDEVYARVPALSDFIQSDPREGEPATEKTEAWILFDDKNLYITARCWDSHPERDVANEMRRDSNTILQNENFAIGLDTFHDKRNGVAFTTTPLGAQRDNAFTDESTATIDWNTVWDVRTGRFEGGWTAEFRIPFKSLRYGPGVQQVWGINLKRTVRWKNETSFLSRIPSFLTQTGIFAVSLAATMTGLEVPTGGKNLEVKPYGIAGLRTDRKATPPVSNEVDKNAGFDVKYGVTKSLTVDLTYRTDFAQVEDDLQQVNLTRFNLFFPERREFFLEGQGIFTFATAGLGGGSTSSTPVLFFSRRIGLNNGLAVPIVGGARMTGKAGNYSIGVLNIQSGRDEDAGARPTNFSVLRIKRDLFRRSNVGVLYTRRAETDGETGAGETFGVDALYSASRSLNINTYYARTRKPGVRGDDASYQFRFDYNADRYGAQVEHLLVGSHFDPQVGFLRRTNFQRDYGYARFSPRPARGHLKAVRRFVYEGNIEYFENGSGTPETREDVGSFRVELLNSDSFTVKYMRDYEFLARPFAIATGVTVPAGGYDYQSGQVSYVLGQQHSVSGTLSYQQGTLYDGTKKTFGFSGGRVELSPQLAIEPGISANWVRLPWGDFTSTVVTGRTTYTISPRMFVSALLQYNSSAHLMSTNARLRWEYQPGSELFVVYSDGRDTTPKGFPQMVNRALIIKVNRLVRF